MRTKVIKNKDGGVIIYQKAKGNYSAVRVGFFVGHDNNTKNGIAHFSEHTWFLGTDNKNSQQVRQVQQEIIPNLNAYTDPSKTCFTFSRTNRLFEQTLNFVSELMFHNKVDGNRFEKEKGVITEEYNRLADRKSVVEQEYKILFKNNTYKIENYVGTPQDIKNMSLEDIMKFRQDNYTRNKFFFAIATELPLWKVKKLVEEYFYTNLPKQEKVEYGVEKIKQLIFDGTPSLKVATEPSINQIQIRIYFKVNEGYLKNRYDYIFDYLNGYFNNMLRANLREKGLVYSSSCGRNFNKNDGIVGISLQTSKEKIPEVLTEINSMFNKVYNENFSHQLFENLQNNFIYAEDEKYDSTNKSQVANDILSYYLYYGNEKNKFTTKKRLKAIKAVKYEDLLPKFKECVNSSNKPFITIMGNIKEDELPTYDEMCKTLLKGLDDKKEMEK